MYVPLIQLVYKVKLDAIGGKLACHSYGQQDSAKSSDLIEEAKTNLMKITVTSPSLFCHSIGLVCSLDTHEHAVPNCSGVFCCLG